jgi:hypothetical protein
MNDLQEELAGYRYHWQVECQWDPPAWVAVCHPTPTGTHVLVAHDLDALRAKVAAVEDTCGD